MKLKPFYSQKEINLISHIKKHPKKYSFRVKSGMVYCSRNIFFPNGLKLYDLNGKQWKVQTEIES
jgi:hypothetical protein